MAAGHVLETAQALAVHITDHHLHLYLHCGRPRMLSHPTPRTHPHPAPHDTDRPKHHTAVSMVQTAMNLDSVQTDETYEAAMNRPAPRLAIGPMSESNLASFRQGCLVRNLVSSLGSEQADDDVEDATKSLPAEPRPATRRVSAAFQNGPSPMVPVPGGEPTDLYTRLDGDTSLSPSAVPPNDTMDGAAEDTLWQHLGPYREYGSRLRSLSSRQRHELTGLFARRSSERVFLLSDYCKRRRGSALVDEVRSFNQRAVRYTIWLTRSLRYYPGRMIRHELPRFGMGQRCAQAGSGKVRKQYERAN